MRLCRPGNLHGADRDSGGCIRKACPVAHHFGSHRGYHRGVGGLGWSCESLGGKGHRSLHQIRGCGWNSQRLCHLLPHYECRSHGYCRISGCRAGGGLYYALHEIPAGFCKRYHAECRYGQRRYGFGGFYPHLPGGIVLLAQYIAPFCSPLLIEELSHTGSLLILAIGLNMIGLTKFKVLNYVPALLVIPFALWISGFASAWL